MPHPIKIATCCYCGTRSALKLDRTRHELACGACGAPLHDMKMIPKTATEQPKPARAASAVGHGQKKRHKCSKRKEYYQPSSRRKPLRKTLKKRARWGREMLEELWDVVEDIFD